MKNLLAWLDVHFEDALCGVLLVGIMIMLMAQVVVRFAFGHGLTFSEELCRFSFLYLVYFAASLVACKGAHIRVTAHTQKLPAPVRVGLLMLADLLWLGFNATVIYQGALLIDSMSTRPMVSGSMLLDLPYPPAVVPAFPGRRFHPRSTAGGGVACPPMPFFGLLWPSASSWAAPFLCRSAWPPHLPLF